MNIDKLLKGVKPISVTGEKNKNISSIAFDSRKVQEGGMFFAVTGTSSNGHDYINNAIQNGATAIVCEQMPEELAKDVTYIEVDDSSLALGSIASTFYGNPSSKLKLVGVTGTNGKTTTATLLYDLLSNMGYKVGLISTVVNRVADKQTEARLTTPDSATTNSLLAEMVDAGCDYCFMEVSSHSIVQQRIAGLTFAGGVFTNISHDHLDYHKTFDQYIDAKKHFFDNLPKNAFALINADDKNGKIMVQNCKAEIKTFSLRTFSDYKCKIMEMLFDGMLLNIDQQEVWVSFLGKFNAYNLLGVYATALLLEMDKTEVLTGISALKPVNGRFEHLRSQQGITAIVDYAHTPDALINVIETINEIRTPEQKLYVVVGCGGDRDKTKRPKMAHIAASQSNLAILTSDNPRTEDPDTIINDMKKGIELDDRYIAITDRRQAIKTAVIMATEGDIILVAGKGHETYQEVNGQRTHFDDKEEILEAFNGVNQVK